MTRIVRYWWSVALDLLDRLKADKISILAAAVAFYALVAAFPALSALVSIYGLVADPASVRTQLAGLEGLVPSEAVTLLSGWLDTLLKAPRSSFGFGLLVSVAVSLWIARNATGTMMVALSIAFGESDARGIVAYNAVAILLTAILILLGVAGVFMVAVLPTLTELLPMSAVLKSTISLLRWPILALMMVFTIALLYRFGPNREIARWEWASAGAVFATVVWILGSIGFSIYVSRFAGFDTTYGSIGAVVVLLLWLWLGAFAVLAGAELNTAIRCKMQSADAGH